jgi:signal transduction histidine kinase/tetratricopeptide (TPR) repeat protein
MEVGIDTIDAYLIEETDVFKRIDMMNAVAYQNRRKYAKRSYELSLHANKLSEELDYQNGIAESLLTIAIHESYNGKIMESLKKRLKAHEIFMELNNVDGNIKSLNSLGFIYGLLGRNEKSLEYFSEGLVLAKEAGNDDMTIFFLSNIAELYRNCLNLFDESLKHHYEAIELSRKIQSSNLAFVLSNASETLLKKNNISKAMEFCIEGLEIAKNSNDKISEALCYKNLGRVYQQTEEKDKALEYCNKSLALYKSLNNKIGQSEILTELGIFFNRIGDTKLALDAFAAALELAEELQMKPTLASIHYNLADIYEKIQDFEKSVSHFRKHLKLNNELVSDELENRLNVMIIEANIQQAKKDTEIFRLRNVELKEKSDEIEQKAKQLEESYKNIATISEIGQKITSSLDIETIMNTIYENMNSLMDATVFGIGLYYETTNTIDYRIFIENGKRIPRFVAQIDPDNSYASKCILNKKEVVHNHLFSAGTPNFIPDDTNGGKDIPPGSLIYCPLIIKSKVIGTITVQSYLENSYNEQSVSTFKALASYIAIAINNSNKSEELKATAKELEITLNNLKETQEYLINQEKMAALGQLISGIAHEINTPLGAIQASISNVSKYIKEAVIEKMPQLFRILDENHQNLFFDILNLSSTKDIMISTRDERKFKRELNEVLKEETISNSDNLADILVDIGIYKYEDKYLPLFKHPEADFIMQTCYELSGILRNIKNMDLAVSKASKMLYALKSYSHITQMDTPTLMNVIDGIDTILELYHNNIKHGTILIKNYSKVPEILCLPDELNQVWTNLIHNALQAMDYKGTLQIDVFEKDHNIIVKITDSGIGIPDEIKNRIFEPFFTTKKQGEGSGLGLGIVKKIILKHKGTIHVDSEPNRTTFTISLPIHMSEQDLV